ncbi:hypothetical protein SAMN05444161_4941 [Rhizobiales bacterium GAS191]|jgi:hypothetical protein|nr:hypothetical protein SAMN05519103_04213 [Rhizobiales bacterium GAS113]SEE13539.1 hypothetical protein SAMN05444161_4941 [Rhizobiales bacterium GAS191]SEE41539.1 hypothetical protein SAMN05519104_6043 [Rhizobiales bacterium GAS188]
MIRLTVGRGPFMRQVKIPFWALALSGTAVVLLGLLLLAFLASLAAIIIPVCLIGAGAAHWFGKSGNSAREPIFTPRRAADPNIIEGEYRVLDEKRR